MQITLVYLFAAFLVLTSITSAESVDCELNGDTEDGYRKEFSEKFAEAFQSLAYRFLHDLIDLETKFYKNIYDKDKTNDKPLNGIKKYLDGLNNMNRHVEEAQHDEKKLGEIIIKFRDYNANAISLLRKENLSLDDYNIQELADEFTSIIDKFCKELLLKWNELYAQVPINDLSSIPSYSEMNDAMQKLNYEKSSKLFTLNDAMNTISLNFHYPYWNNLFRKKNSTLN